MSEYGRDRAADEREILHVLSQLMSLSRIYRMQLADIRHAVEAAAGDHTAAEAVTTRLLAPPVTSTS